MKEQIVTQFSNCMNDNCLFEELSVYFEICDPSSEDGTSTEKCFIVYNENEGHLKIKNPNKQALNFLAIDSCIFQEDTHRKCDIASFSQDMFYFADIKKVKVGQRSSARKEAKEQLEITIEKFKEKLDFSGYKIIAVIALTFRQSFPVAKVSTQDAKIRFEDKFQAELYEGNGINFE